jgi:hypothetical protein
MRSSRNPGSTFHHVRLASTLYLCVPIIGRGSVELHGVFRWTVQRTMAREVPSDDRHIHSSFNAFNARVARSIRSGAIYSQQHVSGNCRRYQFANVAGQRRISRRHAISPGGVTRFLQAASRDFSRRRHAISPGGVTRFLQEASRDFSRGPPRGRCSRAPGVAICVAAFAANLARPANLCVSAWHGGAGCMVPPDTLVRKYRSKM